MQRFPSSKTATSVAILQAMIAVGFGVLGVVFFLSIGPGIDFDKPNHQVTFGQRLAETLLLMGLPVLWSTLAAVFIWYRTEIGWWLSILGDLLVAMFGFMLAMDDLRNISRLRRYPALYSDVAYHLALVLIPSVAIVILLSRSMRNYSSNFRKSDVVLH